MNAQYDIEFEQDIESYYVDQAMSSGIVFSSYTPYGIRCIDSQYGHLIRNVNNKVKQLFAINRREEDCISVRTGEKYKGRIKTFYDPIELNHKGGYEVRVVWENGDQCDFFYGDKPVFDIDTKKSNPDQLHKSIKNNVHLHVMIKENLLHNLNNYIKNGI